MTNPKKFITLIFTVLASTYISAQSVAVKKETLRIKGESMDGFSVELEGTSTEVNSSLLKYLKTFGKTKSADQITLTESTLNGKTYTLPVYALAKENGKMAQAWIGIKTNDWPSGDAENVTRQLEKMIYEFGVQFYRAKIQLQIDESNRALQAVEKQQQRLVNQNMDLNIKLEDNKREKIQLEKSIENNKLQFENLLKRIDQNKKDQDSVLIANGQIKKVIVLQQEKQQQVK